jgi:hypothetical protein
MLAEVLKIISVFLLSSIKFGIGGVPAAVIANFSFFKSMLITISGGVTGVIAFAYLSSWLTERLKKKKKPSKPKKKFTITNKIIVYVKKYFGLIGLSIITPLILSIPLGVFLAVRYYHDKWKVIRYMMVSVTVWAVALYFFFNSFRSFL